MISTNSRRPSSFRRYGAPAKRAAFRELAYGYLQTHPSGTVKALRQRFTKEYGGNKVDSNLACSVMAQLEREGLIARVRPYVGKRISYRSAQPVDIFS